MNDNIFDKIIVLKKKNQNLFSKIKKTNWNNINLFDPKSYNKNIIMNTVNLELSRIKLDKKLLKNYRITEVIIKMNKPTEQYIHIYIFGNLVNIRNINTKIVEYILLKNLDDIEIQKKNLDILIDYGNRDDIGIVILLENISSEIIEEINNWLGINKIYILLSSINLDTNIEIVEKLNLKKKII